jgi:hypothetical protein
LLTWIQVRHAVITQGSLLITGCWLPESCSWARWPVPIHLVFPPPLPVLQAGRDVLYPLLLTFFIWETNQLTLIPSSSLGPLGIELTGCVWRVWGLCLSRALEPHTRHETGRVASGQLGLSYQTDYKKLD